MNLYKPLKSRFTEREKRLGRAAILEMLNKWEKEKEKAENLTTIGSDILNIVKQ